MRWALFVTIGLYALGLLHSCLGFYRKRQIFVSLALAMVVAGFVFHTIFLASLGIQRHHFPICPSRSHFLPGR